MRACVFILLGWLGMLLVAALGSRLTWSYILPDLAIVWVVFLAQRRDPLPAVLTAVALGYLAGHMSLAPFGLHESALVMVTVGVYLAAGHVVGQGGWFFCGMLVVASVAYQALLFALLYWQQGRAGFASWPAAALLPMALCTALVGLLCYPLLCLLEKRFNADTREGFTWH